ncbi:hypothetical protein ACFYQ5_00025 [Streptomyces sp. NPDC005794]
MARLSVESRAAASREAPLYCSSDGQAVEAADIVVPAAFGEIVYEVPVAG